MFIIFSLLFIISGLLGIFFPSFGWYIRYGWMVNGDSEPSDAFIFLSRVGGAIAIVVGLTIIFTGGSILER